MDRTYDQERLKTLRGILKTAPIDSRPAGRPIRAYLAELRDFTNAGNYTRHLVDRDGCDITGMLARQQVLRCCHDPEIPPLAAFALCMAWGGQRMDHYRQCLNSPTLLHMLTELRQSRGTRLQDYAMASGMRVAGLGTTFLSKLLYFLRPTRDAYVIDQWVTKSLQMLVDPCPLRPIKWGGPHPETTPIEYDEACRCLEEIGEKLGGLSGETTEQLLFSHPGGAWRSIIEDTFRSGATASPGRPRSQARDAASGDCPFCRLAEEVRSAHQKALESGRELPSTTTPSVHHICDRVSPCRVYCGRVWDIEFYYHINKNFVRVGAFLPRKVAEKHQRLQARGLEISPDFWGPVEFGNPGTTLSLSIRVRGGSDGHGSQSGDLVSRSANGMVEIYQRINRLMLH